MKIRLSLLIFTHLCTVGFAQSIERLPVKVPHAEPVFFDLIRDLGALKGEKELNVGMGRSSAASGTMQSYFIEYEFAPINRLGLEIELPFYFHKPARGAVSSEALAHGLEGVKAAFQYSFLVSEKHKTTLAIGYIAEIKQNGSNIFNFRESAHNPFLIAAKNWGRIHTLLYTGPVLLLDNGTWETEILINTSIHYVVPGTKQFVGVEVNKKFSGSDPETMIRPQVKLELTSKVALGLTVGIPAVARKRDLDFMIRWIYECHKNRH